MIPDWTKLARSVVVVVLAIVGVGCETGRMTLAQELAWDRWKMCDNISGVTLKEVRTDGQIWVYYTSNLTAWQECDRKAAAAQGRTAAAPPPASQVIPARAVGSGPIVLPTWKVGSEWAYRYETPAGTGTFVWSLDRIETYDGQPHYVIKTGTREIFYRVTDLAFSLETVNKEAVRRVMPSDWRWVAFPLEPGKSWDMKFHESRPADRQTEEIERRCVAEAEETVTVPAGTFPTVRVRCTNARNDAWLVTIWYSPQVTHLVREETAVTGGKRIRELVNYRLR